ncbi:DUF397 domain-containing protein [Streptomyces xanthochromogenes]|uniref:Transcriptional regulator n=1 Tax=Streptomyces xanthochromogenes TaxID=67384 RepID=A0ABQ3AEK3_9ACTN|nr:MULTISPECIES: DUF397 domain-containing protein [Streptomyces]MYV95490.1 DUF397 domain-containing protein [Streptomyces sp. SID1034]GGY43695.1 transcriptional regulator [Streptomyces xanthochromogenes]GHB38612.1 transcriptional regulator [Streptomyces xanthochromogenes]
MAGYGNGVRADEIANAVWVKATASDAYNDCVEIARLPQGEVALRNSRFPQGPALVFTSSELAAFLDGARKGEFDGMVG